MTQVECRCPLLSPNYEYTAVPNRMCEIIGDVAGQLRERPTG